MSKKVLDALKLAAEASKALTRAPQATRMATTAVKFAVKQKKPEASEANPVVAQQQRLPKMAIPIMPKDLTATLPVVQMPKRHASTSARTTKTPDEDVLVIGYGNMAKAVVAAFLNANPRYTGKIVICSPSIFTKGSIPSGENIELYNDPSKIGERKFGKVILGIKPQKVDILKDYKHLIKEGALLISMLAGTPTERFSTILDDTSLRVIRTMPNTPMQIKNGKKGNCGVTGFFGNAKATTTDLEFAQEAFGGTAVTVKTETKINEITAVSGSGPAYFFYVVEAFSKALQNRSYNLEGHADDESTEKPIFRLMKEACELVPEGMSVKAFKAANQEKFGRVEKLMSGADTMQEMIQRVIDGSRDSKTGKLDHEAVKFAMLHIASSFIDAAAIEEGKDKNVEFTYDDAQKLVMQTMYGSAELGMQSGEAAAALRTKVTSPSGTTFYGLKVLMDNEVDPKEGKPVEKKPMTLREICEGTFRSACDRAYELAKPKTQTPTPAPNGASSHGLHGDDKAKGATKS